MFEVFKRGILKENPALVLLLGTCPSLAVTGVVKSAVGMGLATTFVILCSSLAISLLRNIIPSTVRLPCFIVIIAGFATLVSLILQAYFYDLYEALGVFLALIAVNCIVMARAEVFASKNKPIMAILDALGMGLGFTLALFLISTIREIFGAGSFLGVSIPIDKIGLSPMAVFSMPTGGFFTYGVIIAIVGVLQNRQVPEISCSSCPAASVCKEAKLLEQIDQKEENNK